MRTILTAIFTLVAAFGFAQGGASLTRTDGRSVVLNCQQIKTARSSGSGSSILYGQGESISVTDSLGSVRDKSCGELLSFQVIEGSRQTRVLINRGIIRAAYPGPSTGATIQADGLGSVVVADLWAAVRDSVGSCAVSGGSGGGGAPGGGTVTSIGLSLPSIFSVSGSPVSTSGTISATLGTQNANLVFTGPATGSPATPTFRSLVAADVPNLDAAKITTGTVPVARGGTGLTALGSGLQVLRVNAGGTALEYAADTLNLMLAASDETSNLTTGTAKITFRAPRAMTLVGIRANVNTAPVGSTIIVDVNEDGASIFSTCLSIDASEKTSVTAAVPPVFSDTAIANDAEITVDIDQIGSSTAGKGLKISLYYTK